MKFRGLTAIAMLVVFAMGCGTTKKIEKTYPPAPSWVNNRPISSEYYVGVGSAKKTLDMNQTMQTAKQNALADMASDISVNISTNSILSTFDYNQNFSEDFSKTVKAQAEQDLEGYETVGNYEDQNNYYVYFRLSKSSYQKLKEERKAKAVTKALDLFDKGFNAEKSGDVRFSLISYIKALEPLKPYFADPLQVQYQGKEIYLGNEISKEINRILSAVRIDVNSKQVRAKQGQQLPAGTLDFKVLYANNAPLSGFTLSGSYTEKPLRNSKVQTDNNGIASFSLDAIRSNKNLETITATLNIEEIVNEATTDFMLRKLASRFRVPEAAISINVIKPTFFISSSESNLENKLSNSPLMEGLRKKLIEGGYAINNKESDADYRIAVKATTQTKGEVGTYKQTSLNATISVKDKIGAELYIKQIDNIIGSHFDYAQAGIEAYKEATKKVENTISREIFEMVVKGRSSY